MIHRHRLAPEAFSALASGGGGTATVDALRESRLARHLLLMRFVAGAWPGDPAERDAALAALGAAQELAPDRVARVLADPLIGAWATWTGRRIRGHVKEATPLRADLGHLPAIAAVATAASGGSADLRGYARHGVVSLPGLGAVRLPVPDLAPVELTVRAGAVTVHSGQGSVTVSADPRTGVWREVRRLRATSAGMSCEVALDDLDPYRGGHHAPPADRLPADEFERWQGLFGDTWALLAGAVPARAAELAAGLRVLVPLVPGAPGTARSATTPDAFGALGLTLPPSPADFAVTLVHEFQHSKLSAVLDLVPLCDPADDRSYFAPWRTDPRPIGGLLQGVYAFLGVADTWRSLRGRTGLTTAAVQEFADVRAQVDETLTVLEDSGGLTPAGRRFAAGMRCTADAFLAESLPDAAVRRARERLDRNRQAWAQRNGRLAG
jgi:HEXXH motif-containing protein